MKTYDPNNVRGEIDPNNFPAKVGQAPPLAVILSTLPPLYTPPCATPSTPPTFSFLLRIFVFAHRGEDIEGVRVDQQLGSVNSTPNVGQLILRTFYPLYPPPLDGMRNLSIF